MVAGPSLNAVDECDVDGRIASKSRVYRLGPEPAPARDELFDLTLEPVTLPGTARFAAPPDPRRALSAPVLHGVLAGALEQVSPRRRLRSGVPSQRHRDHPGHLPPSADPIPALSKL